MLLRLATILATAALPAAAGAQMRPASADQMAAAAKSCVAATTAKGIDLTRLQSDGWQVASLVGPDKKTLQTPLQLLSRPDSNVTILLNGVGAGKPCITTSRIKSVSVAPRLTSEIGQALGAQQLRSPNQSEVIWRVGSVLVLVQASGSQDQPGLRLSTIYAAPEKK